MQKTYNPKYKDSSSKLIFGDSTLCAQFLRNYINVPILKNVQPEDIEDVSERYVPLFTTEREADSVKKIKLPNGDSLFFYLLLNTRQK